MFSLVPTLTSLDLADKKVLTLAQSVNRPLVAAADFPAEETQAYVVTAQAKDHSLETFIYLHLMESIRSVIYRADSNPFMGDRLEEIESEAVDFVESMGFMMDNLRFARLPQAERDKLQEQVPVFYADLKDYLWVLDQRREQTGHDLVHSPPGESPGGGEEPAAEPEGIRPELYIAGAAFPEQEDSMQSPAEEKMMDAVAAAALFPEQKLPPPAPTPPASQATDEDLNGFFEPAAPAEPPAFAAPPSPPEPEPQPVSQPEPSETAAQPTEDISLAGESMFEDVPSPPGGDDLAELAEIEQSLSLEESQDGMDVTETQMQPAASEISSEERLAFLRLFLTL